jgi:hypothetical protein
MIIREDASLSDTFGWLMLLYQSRQNSWVAVNARISGQLSLPMGNGEVMIPSALRLGTCIGIIFFFSILMSPNTFNLVYNVPSREHKKKLP